jgi:hypothetical protein
VLPVMKGEDDPFLPFNMFLVGIYIEESEEPEA